MTIMNTEDDALRMTTQNIEEEFDNTDTIYYNRKKNVRSEIGIITEMQKNRDIKRQFY